MLKTYKRDDRGRLLFREAWATSPGEAVVHTGTVGRRGKSEQRVVTEGQEAFLAAFERDARSRGFAPIPRADQLWLVVQFPLRSKMGNKRDAWLLEKGSEYLNNELGWRGLGHVDGHDRGNHKLNIFCVVVDAPLAVTAAKSCLRTSRLDLNRARIATRGYSSDEDYVLRYSKKPVSNFSVV